jgi:mono/diheme cytochrome c family protein
MTMEKAVRTVVAFVLSMALYSPLLADDSSTSLQSAFQTHCVKCHGKGDKLEGKVNLLSAKSDGDLRARPELLEKVITVLQDREMPPEDEPALPAEKRQRMVRQLQALLDETLKTQPFGPTPIRRMNRFQYNNAVVDLLELDRDIFQLNERLLRRRDDYFRPETRKMPAQVRVSSRPLAKDIDNQRPEGFNGVAAFPQDKRAEHGFDNRADHLTLSPLLMESFLTLSQTIVESSDLNHRECRAWDRIFAPPGQSARGPVEGRYEAEEGGPIKVVGTPKERVWSQGMSGWGPYWSGNTQLIWMCREKGRELTLSFAATQAGTGIRVGFTKAPDYGTFELFLDGAKLGKAVDLYDPKVVRAADLDFRDVKIAPGQHSLKIRCVGKREQSRSFLFGMDYLEVTGREPTKKQVTADSSPVDVIRSRLKDLLRRAFRRPVDPETVDRFTKFAEQQLAAGASFEDTMRTIVGAVLGMPDFLYSYETIDKEKPGTNGLGRQRVNDFELASRLAQFFWSSIPDDTLLDVAEAGTLSDSETLSTQIDRMMNDKRSSRFCDNFPGQWLQLDRLITSIPDPKKFPYFYYLGYRTSLHMMSEPLLLFDTVYIEDRSILDLLDPKFTWQSDMLRRNYEGQSNGRHDVQVQLFKRIPLDDPRRGGVITNAAVMTMTSTPTRTQPITRGAWVNEVIFNDPPEPPPADVPPLPEVDKEELEKLTIRERLALHRERADCAGCHDKIDPLGFALENYGPTGVWRDKYENGREVDSSGVLFNQHEFKTVAEFKRLILLEKHRFVRGFVSHLLSYALGRKLGPADSPALTEMTKKVMAGNDQLRAVLKSIAMSEPFLHKNTQTPSGEK